MQWFGPKPVASVASYFEWAPRPIGMQCDWCNEEIGYDDCGFIFGTYVYHHECLVRQAVGSVTHQLEQCSCFVPGATEDDPPELTRRQAARLAVELYQETRWKLSYKPLFYWAIWFTRDSATDALENLLRAADASRLPGEAHHP